MQLSIESLKNLTRNNEKLEPSHVPNENSNNNYNYECFSSQSICPNKQLVRGFYSFLK